MCVPVYLSDCRHVWYICVCIHVCSHVLHVCLFVCMQDFVNMRNGVEVEGWIAGIIRHVAAHLTVLSCRLPGREVTQTRRHNWKIFILLSYHTGMLHRDMRIYLDSKPVLMDDVSFQSHTCSFVHAYQKRNHHSSLKMASFIFCGTLWLTSWENDRSRKWRQRVRVQCIRLVG